MSGEKDHGLFAFSEMGEGHPNTCFEDGIQVATGATYAKRLLRNLNLARPPWCYTTLRRGRCGWRFALK